MISHDEEDEHSAWNLFLDVAGQSRSGHAGGKFPRRRGACEDSAELSSFSGSPLPGGAGCLAV